MGLTFVRLEDGDSVAASIGPARAQLAEARARLERSVQPSVRPAPG